MSVFPGGIFSQRTLENVTGVVYDAAKKTKIFAEDLLGLGDEVTAIEETLGVNPQGDFDTVAERIAEIEENGVGGSSRWYYGTGVPDDGVGADGDFYLRTTNGDVYAKESGTWGDAVANLTGPTGATGETGAAGEQGEPGDAGAPGDPGADGATWYSGSGAPDNGSGANGDFYFRTSTGDVYTKSGGTWGSPVANLTGPTGATGSTGATGATGAQGNPGPNANVQIFTTTGSTQTWTKPSGYTFAHVFCISGGGGGGSGSKASTTTNRNGGAGGGGGAIARGFFALAALGSTEDVIVGAGGNGGASQTTNTSNGNPGTDGGFSTFGGTAENCKLVAYGGTGGIGGTRTSGNAGASDGGWAGDEGAGGGGQGWTTGAVPLIGLYAWLGSPGGGTGGGLNTSNQVQTASSAGGIDSRFLYIGGTGYTGGGGGTGAQGGDSTDLTTSQHPYCGQSGGGGGAAATGNAGRGGHGGRWGGAGGGGGASTNSSGNSGAGGNGAQGIVVVVCV